MTAYDTAALFARGKALRAASREIKARGRNSMNVLALKRALRAKRKARGR